MATLEALELVIDRSSGGGKVSREFMKKKLRKAFKQGRLRDIAEVNDPEWKFRLCCANLLLGDYSWEGWEFRDPWATMLWYNPNAVGKRWNGEAGRVLILGEQGLGDEVMFASCIKDLQKTNEVGITCIPRLQSVFQRSFDCETYDRHEGKELSRARELIKRYDYFIALGDLPRYFRKSSKDFTGEPFLKPLGKGKYTGIGISWRGRNGYYPLKDFPKGISLQYDMNWDEEVETPDIDVRNDIEGLLTLINGLDKVVCVSTTVAHLSGAIGKETDVILAPVETARSGQQINWRWGSRWYKSVNVFQSMKQWRSEVGV